ncbi:peptide-N4-(N-acetyl-beta- glucosaminyl)asparagine amidase [Dissophora globulifera]|uniref:Peptide-N4-(N-acetyl-beta-glucosaminyl)asparagine amidase n=1 Tax=Dissophora globulifera TaxID=979702 RepID=A0A9P6R589_9FUNG|nr:peptide-N4-(N-acetyl-beta- glucosaminyl)asparagine amidase [Dissophora globulifera]
MNQREIDTLAQQLASQFSAMRQQQRRTSPGAVTTTTSATVAATATATVTTDVAEDTGSGSSIDNLTRQLGDLRELSVDTTTLDSSTAHPQESEGLTSPLVDPYATVPDPSIYEKEFADTYLRVNASVLRFEDLQLLDLACEQIPMERLYEEAEVMREDYPDDSVGDIVIRRLLHWFKNEYFTWVNEPPCASCQAKTVAVGTVAPTAQEMQDGAGVVEAYQCTQSCSTTTRFPRYGGMSTILFKTRRGRCGEWANCFTVFCRAIGYQARYVHDTTDHVWTEVWSQHKKRWIHCDACEAAYDQPLLYSTGWGKSLSYCVAFSGKLKGRSEEVVDVTRRYTIEYDTSVLKRRRSIRELVLAKFLHRMSESNLARLSLDPTELQAVRQRQGLEMDALLGRNGDTRAIETQDRESGSDEWTKARGERR